MERKWRARLVVDKENITDSERNQRRNFSNTSRFAILSDDQDAPTAEELVGQPSSEKPVAQPEQQILPKQLAEPPDGKDAGVVDIMVNYEGVSQPVFGQEGEDTMSDDEDTVVQETPGVHVGLMVELDA
ncbi:hypothetical protein WN943_011507 [Citrus x changshan-huyou]